MLDRVRIQNFRCLRDVDVPLKPLTVLIGENDTGKSTFLEAIAFRGGSDAAQNLGGPRQVEFRKLDHWRGNLSNEVELEFSSGGGDPFKVKQKTSGAAPQRQIRGPEGGSRSAARALRINHLQIDPMTIRFSGSQLTDAAELPDIDSRGQHVPGVMDRMLRGHRRQFDRMETRCRELVRGFDAFSIVVPKQGVVALSLWLSGEIELPSDRASAGVRALILYLTLAYRPDAPDVVLVEEPENGLHPHRLGEVMGLLRLLTEPKADGRRTQVILTTHSPFLLDHVRPDEDQVLIFQRQADGSRTATPADWDRAKAFLSDFTPGEIWFNRGEASLVPAPELDEGSDAFDALGRRAETTSDGAATATTASEAADARAAA